jgi:hypothetical protein
MGKTLFSPSFFFTSTDVVHELRKVLFESQIVLS